MKDGSSSPGEGEAGPLSRGVFILSIDTEFAWGCFDREDRETRWAMEKRSREVVTRLLALFAAYQIPATWATVGHLFLDSCRKVDGCVHPEIPRPRPAWFEGDWYRFDPGSSAAQAPLWYAPDVLEQLQAARPVQEIACHSFSHPLFDDPGCSEEAAEADLEACVRAAAARRLELSSFVYPRNRVAHLHLLQRHGFHCYRGADPQWYRRFPRLLRRVSHYLDDLLALPPPTVMPRKEQGIWNIPGSVMLQGMDGIRRWIPGRCRTLRAQTGLRRAARSRRIFHLWFHPINFTVRMEAMLAALEPVLRSAAALRDRGELEILTMGTLASRLRRNDRDQGISTPHHASARHHEA